MNPYFIPVRQVGQRKCDPPNSSTLVKKYRHLGRNGEPGKGYHGGWRGLPGRTGPATRQLSLAQKTRTGLVGLFLAVPVQKIGEFGLEANGLKHELLFPQFPVAGRAGGSRQIFQEPLFFAVEDPITILNTKYRYLFRWCRVCAEAGTCGTGT